MTEQETDRLKHVQTERFNNAHLKKDDGTGSGEEENAQNKAKEQDYEMER